MYNLAYVIWASSSLYVKILNKTVYNDNLVQMRQSAGLDALNLQIVTDNYSHSAVCEALHI